MEKFTLGNAKGLKQLCDEKQIPNFVTLDGWKLVVELEDPAAVFALGIEFAKFNDRNSVINATLEMIDENYEMGLITPNERDQQKVKAQSRLY